MMKEYRDDLTLSLLGLRLVLCLVEVLDEPLEEAQLNGGEGTSEL